MVDAVLEHFLAEQKQHCERLLEEGETNEEESGKCAAFFDGLLCWPSTVGPRIVALPCPLRMVSGYRFSEAKSEQAVATKACLANGRWYVNPENVVWGNYSLCEPWTYRHLVNAINDLESKYMQGEYEKSNGTLFDKWLPIIRTMSQIGYASSFVILLVAMIIFSVLRKLRSPRNKLHMHLFASFMMRAFMALLKDWIFVDGVGLAWDVVLVDGKSAFIKERNTWMCKAITSVWQYFIVANYAWILMEGLYLHNLVFLALCADTTAITSYVIFGWGLPGLVVIPWIVIRATIEDTLCWTTHDNPSFFLVIRIPIMISILFNFLLFVNIVRVLFIKMKTSVHLQRKKMQYRRWAKSTLVLVPLFGAHYTLLLGLSYNEDHRVELVWLFSDQLFASFQGFFVALLYCLLNGEVRAEMQRSWKICQSKRNVDAFYLHASGHRDFVRTLRSQATRFRDQSRYPVDLNARALNTRNFSLP